jgi:hypothetical protein
MAEIVKKTKAPAKPKLIEPGETKETPAPKVARKAAAAAPAKPQAKATKAAGVTEKVSSGDETGLRTVPVKAKAAKAAKPETPAATPSREQIAQLAHRFWKERGGHHGSHEQDWFRAERELRGMAS